MLKSHSPERLLHGSHTPTHGRTQGNAPPGEVILPVLKHEGGDWKIVHTHMSPMAGN